MAFSIKQMHLCTLVSVHICNLEPCLELNTDRVLPYSCIILLTLRERLDPGTSMSCVIMNCSILPWLLYMCECMLVCRYRGVQYNMSDPSPSLLSTYIQVRITIYVQMPSVLS